MDRFQSAITLSLRETEKCTAAVEVTDLSPGLGELQSRKIQATNRVLGVVTHEYPDESGIDEGKGGGGVREEGW